MVAVTSVTSVSSESSDQSETVAVASVAVASVAVSSVASVKGDWTHASVVDSVAARPGGGSMDDLLDVTDGVSSVTVAAISAEATIAAEAVAIASEAETETVAVAAVSDDAAVGDSNKADEGEEGLETVISLKQ